MYELFDEVFSLMVASFPKEEYRSYEGQKKLLENPNYYITVRQNEKNELIGFICSWKTSNFSFIEHFAVKESERGKGIGSIMLKEFINTAPSPIILEVELPKDELSFRRISFYERFGFIKNEFEYYQMPLRENINPIKMYLMSYPRILSKVKFEEIKKCIYKKIYLTY